MAAAALCVIVTVFWAKASIAKRHREGRAPGGFGTAIEAMVIFVRDDIVMPAMGHGGEKYLPYILTLFFFILFCNFFGLVPWGATATGNIAVTAGLALISFVVIEVSGMFALGARGYLRTIVMVPPGMTGVGAVGMAVILTPIEIIGKLVKPFALCLRLFANMTGGHFVILSLMGLIFIFGSWLVAGASVAMILFMMLLEMLIALLQAYIFALLTSVFIGMMLHEH
jgi:F-type H+-transporting ATPase subunit a